MDVQQRENRWGDGDLPGGLAFLDDDRLPNLPRRRGRLGTVAWLVVLAVLVALGGPSAVRWVGEGDVREALASSTATYSRVLSQLRLAHDVTGLSTAATTAAGAADRVEAALSQLDGGGGRRAVVADQLAAERDVLRAVSALAGIDRAPLAVWGAAHPALADAVATELRTRAALQAVDDGVVRRLPDAADTLRRVSATVGGALVGDVQRAAGELLASLGAASTTGDLRAAARHAPAQRAAVVVAGEALTAPTERAVLDAFADALLAVARLRHLTPTATEVWAQARPSLAAELAVVGDADASLSAGTVRARLPGVLAHVDGVVGRAAAAHAAWQAVHAAAVAEQARDAAQLTRYAAALQAWGAAHAELAQGVQAAQADTSATPQQLATQLGELARAAARLRDAVRVEASPPGLEQVHAELAGALPDVVAPLQRAVTVLLAADCAHCPDGGTAVVAELAAVDAAVSRWAVLAAAAEAARVDHERAVAARELPAEPDA